jgi:hypothetical protein
MCESRLSSIDSSPSSFVTELRYATI